MRFSRAAHLLIVLATLGGVVASASATPVWRCADGSACPLVHPPRPQVVEHVAGAKCCESKAKAKPKPCHETPAAQKPEPKRCVLDSAGDVPSLAPARAVVVQHFDLNWVAFSPTLIVPAVEVAPFKSVSREDDLPPPDRSPKICRAPRAPPF